MVAGKRWAERIRAASSTAATPEASSLAPGASCVASSGSLIRLSIWALMITTRPGSVVPRWMAITSWTTVGLGTRSPVTVWSGVTNSRQPAHRPPIASNRPFAHRRAAPMPRVSEAVSDRVCRVPNATSRVIVAVRFSGFTDPAMDRSWGSGPWAGAAIGAATSGSARENVRTGASIGNFVISGP